MSSVYKAELWGVLEGLKLVVAMDFQKVILEVDSQQVVNDITTSDQSSNMGRHLITKIRTLMHQDREIKIRHIYRKNQYMRGCISQRRKITLELFVHLIRVSFVS